MATFELAYKRTVLGFEIGYNPGKGEAETVWGIDRSMWPHWTGWEILDHFKKDKSVKEVNTFVRSNVYLQNAIKTFYKNGFWDTVRLTEITSQPVANAIFDSTVNPCIDTSIEVLQKACNVVHPLLLKVDGSIGDKTILAANTLNPGILLTAINAIRSANYHHRVALSPKMKQWLPDWLARLKPEQTLNNV